MKHLKWAFAFAVIILACAAVFHFGSANNAKLAVVSLLPGGTVYVK